MPSKRIKKDTHFSNSSKSGAQKGDSKKDSKKRLKKTQKGHPFFCSSGQHTGRLTITKRGPGRARHDLFLSAMRFVQKDAVVRAWYRKKVERDGRLSRYNALVAVTRKLSLAIWHVARGAPFDSRTLFDLKTLGMAA